ncbi:MAG: hypothetical protein HZB91_01000 [Elusimicrobia bacterium]|nr:hypothetical protein [Elusimicrobiota bacterium]
MTAGRSAQRAGWKGKLRELAPKFALSLGSLFFAYVACELAVFPVALSYFSYKLQWRVDLPFLVFTQSTKRHRIPKDYVLILGDSYAVGLGNDWDNMNRWTRRAIGSQAALHAKTGRDIITMGHAGAGSLGGLIGDPAGKFAFLNRTVLYKLPQPNLVLAYFYEGNDLDNNIRDLASRYTGKYDSARLKDPEYFKRFIREAVVEQDETYKRTRRFHLDQNLVFWKFCKSSFRKLWEVLSRVVPEASAAAPSAGGGRPLSTAASGYLAPASFKGTHIRLGSRTLPVPDRLQGPSLELTPEEADLAVYVFEQALSWLKDFFPGTKIIVVYIPSPISTYELASDWVSVEAYHERAPYHEARKVGPASDRIAGKIEGAALRQGCGFVDTRPVMRSAAKTELLHGGSDWMHLTRKGYSVLAEAILPIDGVRR